MASGAGGGGRISVWTGDAVQRGLVIRRVGKYDAANESARCSFHGVATATGGTNAVVQLPSATGATLNGGDGTVRFVHYLPPVGFILGIR